MGSVLLHQCCERSSSPPPHPSRPAVCAAGTPARPPSWPAATVQEPPAGAQPEDTHFTVL